MLGSNSGVTSVENALVENKVLRVSDNEQTTSERDTVADGGRWNSFTTYYEVVLSAQTNRSGRSCRRTGDEGQPRTLEHHECSRVKPTRNKTCLDLSIPKVSQNKNDIGQNSLPCSHLHSV